ncbi:MAG: tetratricopeptide repeat protein [Bryobacteraceae bacterium]
MARRDRSTQKSATTPPRVWPPWRIALALAALTFAVFARTIGFDFIRFDDDLGVYLNPQIHKGLTPESIVWAFRTTELGFWFPLTRLSQLLDVSLFGMNASGHHFTNVAQHAATVAVLFLAFERLTGDRWKSALAALLFAVHPLRIESVAWVIERKDTLSGFFWALSLLAYARFARGATSIVPVAAAFLCALLSKPNVVTLPAILLLIDFWPLRRLNEGVGKLVIEKLPLFAMSAALTAITVFTQKDAGALDLLRGVDTAQRLANIPVAYVLYLRDTVWPWNRSVLYPFEYWAAWQIAAAGLLLAALTGLILARARTAPWIAAGWLWFLIALLPNIGIVQAGVQSRADRFTYLGHMGLFLGLVWTLAQVISARANLVIGAWAAVLALLTIVQTGYWKDTPTLLEHSLAITPRATLLLTNLGLEYMDRGQYEPARALFARGVEIAPDDIGPRNNLVNALVAMNRDADAMQAAEEAIRRFPQSDLSYSMRARVFIATQRPAEAIADIDRAIARTEVPAERAAHLHQRGVALHSLGRFAESEAELRRAIALDPARHSVERDLANSLAAQKRYPEALAAYSRYLTLVPDDPVAQQAAAQLRAYLQPR